MKCEILSQGKYVNQTFRLIYEVQNRIYIGVTKKRKKIVTDVLTCMLIQYREINK